MGGICITKEVGEGGGVVSSLNPTPLTKAVLSFLFSSHTLIHLQQ